MPRPFRWIACAIGGVLLPLAALLAAQEPSATFRGGIDLVTLDVSVLDKNRHPVKGLTADNFTVLEDGKPQSIVSVNAIDLPDATGQSTPQLRHMAPDVVSNQSTARRVVVIVMDDTNTNTDIDMAEGVTARRIGRAVIEQLGEDDLGAVTFTGVGRRQNLTGDHAQLLEAVDSFNIHSDAAGHRLDSIEDAYRARREALGSTTSPNPPPYCAYSGKAHGVGACVVETLGAVAQALAGAPAGRKTVVYVGNGIPYDFSMTDLSGWRNRGQDVEELQAMLRSLQEANINVYALNLCGVKCGIVGAQQDSLRVFAEETGGRAILGTNAPETGVSQIFVENSSYYLLGFHTSNQLADGQFRRIQVRVNLPGAEVNTRSGYYAPLLNKTGAARTTEPPLVDRALAKSVPSGSLPLAMTVAPVAVRGTSQASLAITIGLREPLPPGRHIIELVTTAIDYGCPECKRQSNRQRIEFVPELSRAVPVELYEMQSRLPVTAGRRYHVRAAATLGDRLGTVFTDVEVPNFTKDPLSVSGLGVSLAPPPAVTAQPRAFSDVLPLVPSTVRDLDRGMTATVFLRMTQGGTAPPVAVRVTATIRNDRNGVDFERTASIEPSSFDAARSADYRLELPIAALTPGPYLLTIEMSLGSPAVSRDIRFTIK